MNKNYGNCKKNLEIFIETLQNVYLVNYLLVYHKKLEGNALHDGFKHILAYFHINILAYFYKNISDMVVKVLKE